MSSISASKAIQMLTDRINELTREHNALVDYVKELEQRIANLDDPLRRAGGEGR